MPQNKNANQNRPQTWWAKLLEKIGLGSFEAIAWVRLYLDRRSLCSRNQASDHGLPAVSTLPV